MSSLVSLRRRLERSTVTTQRGDALLKGSSVQRSAKQRAASSRRGARLGAAGARSVRWSRPMPVGSRLRICSWISGARCSRFMICVIRGWVTWASRASSVWSAPPVPEKAVEPDRQGHQDGDPRHAAHVGLSGLRRCGAARRRSSPRGRHVASPRPEVELAHHLRHAASSSARSAKARMLSGRNVTSIDSASSS